MSQIQQEKSDQVATVTVLPSLLSVSLSLIEGNLILTTTEEGARRLSE